MRAPFSVYQVTDYQTLVFDCDGVILNSNAVKTEAFYNAALPYGRQAAEALVDHHVANGGISRYEKFSYFLNALIAPGTPGPDLANLLSAYAREVRSGLLTCEIAEGLHDLRSKTQHAKWLIASGGDQSELREVFLQRGLDMLFDGGIFGSPDSKVTILDRETKNQNIISPCLFLGDSKYDYLAADQAGFDFVFISQWTEVRNWRLWCEENSLKALESLVDL